MAETSLTQIVSCEFGPTNSCRICDKVSLSGGRLEHLRKNFLNSAWRIRGYSFLSCTADTGSFDQRGLSRRNVRLIHESAKPRIKPAVRQKFIVATALDDLPALEHKDLIGVTNG
jgi:hypothetical protein